mmetsp:Transcript_16000/g.44039  ORF Transcript_16000/g.44039 Transcript_16000/m.44039 type:complete len:291 (+) Transcript_16000:117-989(+)
MAPTTDSNKNEEDDDNVVDVDTGDAEPKQEGATTTNLPTMAALDDLPEAEIPLAGTFVSALILLVALLVDGDGAKNWAYGITVATVTMFLALSGAVMALIKKDEANAQISQVNSVLLYFLFGWCFVGACILTFNGPYTVTSNGYFAAWAMVVFSLLAAGCSLQLLNSVVQGMGAILALGAAASVVLIAVADRGISGSHKANLLYSIILAPLTLILVAALYLQGKGGDDKRYMGATVQFVVLACWAICWIVQASLVTFDGPFVLTGNGYFGSWGAAVASVVAAMESFPKTE